MRWSKLRNRVGYLASSLQAISSVLLLGASTLLISSAATHVPIMMLMTLVVAVRAFAIGRAAFRYVERLTLHDSAFRMLERVRVQVFKKLEPIAPIGLKEFNRGDLVSRMVDDVDELQNLQLRVLPGILQSAVATFLVFALVMFYAPNLAFITLIIMVVSFAGAFGTSYFSGSKKQSQVAQKRSELYTSLTDVSERADVLLAFGWRSQAENRVATQSAALVGIEKTGAKAAGFASAILILGLAITQLVSALVGAQMVTSGSTSRVLLASLVLLPTAVFEFYQLALPAVGAYKRFIGSKKRVDQVLDLEPTKFDGEKKLSSFDSLNFNSAVVRFTAGSSIRLPDFKLSSGSSLSIMGRSGSGKSTLANVLVGFLPVAEGEVLINGFDVASYSHDTLRETIGLVEQSSNLLIGSVAINLRIAKPTASDDELIDVLRKVGLWSMLASREGLATEVGENGGNLSGGEGSRIGLARILLARRELVIFDEPTAALDRELAHELVADFVRISKAEHKTLILITHDPDLIGYCDESISF